MREVELTDMDTRCRIELFAGVRVRWAGRVITRFSTQKTAALLAYLAYYPQRSHSREVLIEMLWPDRTPQAGRNSLSVALSSLRRLLEPPGVPAGAVLQADAATIQLNADAFTTDVAEFEAALVAADRSAGASARVEFLREAVAMYTGSLLPGYYEDWLFFEQERLAEQFVQATLQLAAHFRNEEHFQQALTYARRVVQADPVREEAHTEVMRLLAALGQPGAALRQYEELRRVLREELGQIPSVSTDQLATELGHHEPQTPAVPIPHRSPNDIPPSPGPLPTGMVTFLLIDVEAGILPRQEAEPALALVIPRCRERLNAHLGRLGGHLLKAAGATFTIAFARPSDALDGAVAGQRLLSGPELLEESRFKLRMALHTGEVKSKDRHRQETTLDLAAQLLTTARGGQILCSEETARLLRRGLEPGLRLVDLGLYRLRQHSPPERLFAIDYPGMPQSALAVPEALPAYAGHLPVRLTQFFGREEELARLEALFSGATRLLTLSGPGGSGKTRLALEVADRLYTPLSGAVWFVPLADLSAAELIAGMILDVLVQPRSAAMETFEQVVTVLSRQPSLLVLDNFEHLVEEGALIVQSLLERVPTLTCLVTSRQCLDLEGEQEFVVLPLPTPQHEANLLSVPSVQLFVDRAQMVRPDFQVTKANSASVARLCDRLEGLPLAIELAASRVRVMTPAQMLSELVNRFEFLVSRRRAAVARHQTLRAAIDWSYRLLSAEQQRLFARLSVFRGGWTAEAAEAVCTEQGKGTGEWRQPEGRTLGEEGRVGEFLFANEVLNLLERLREASLIQVEESGTGMRFRMLETLREYAAEQLSAAEHTDLAQRHVDYFVNLAAEGDAKYASPEHVAWVDRLQREHENLHAALTWCTRAEADPHEESGLRLARHICPTWHRRGYTGEGRRYLRSLLARHDPNQRTVARAWATHTAALLADADGDSTAARPLFEEALAMWRELADPVGLAESLTGLGWVVFDEGDRSTAGLLYEESLAHYREAGHRRGVGSALGNLGWIAFEKGDYATARKLNEESLAIYRELGAWGFIAGRIGMLARIAVAQRDYARAHSLYEESLGMRREAGDLLGIVAALHSLGDLAHRQGDDSRADALLDESLALSRQAGSRTFEALSLHDKGIVAVACGDLGQARSLYAESLTIKRSLGHRLALIQTIEALAALAASDADWERAATLFSAAATQREKMGALLPPDLLDAHERLIARARGVLELATFEAAWNEGAAFTLEQALDLATQLLAPASEL